MIIYQNSKAGFVNDVDNNDLQPKLEAGFKSKTGSIPADRSVWASEYAQFSGVLRKSQISDEIQVAIEYHLSSIGRSRIDVLLAGNDGNTDNGLIIELKAWDKAEATDIENMVFAPVAGGSIKQHPSLQARQYKGMIMRFNHDILEKGIQLYPSAYLFNLRRRNPEPLEDSRYKDLLIESQLFLADDVSRLRTYFEELIPKKTNNDVLFLLDQGRWRPADELISRVESMLEGNEEFQLIDEQNEAFQIIRHQVLGEKDITHRHVFVVEGGPGTGKSVIAVRLLAETLKRKRMAFFVAPNMAFREALINSLSKGDKRYREDGQSLFKSSWSFHQADYRKDERSEILVVDEAHRLKDKAYQYKGKSMVEDMVRSARISIFFIDESQIVSWNDTGSINSIKAAADKFKANFHSTLKLTSQFRCNGSTGYLNWLDDVLQIRSTGNYDNWGDGQYEFRVFDRADELYKALKEKNTDNKARLVAGYSWEWPSKGRERGTLAKHVQVDGLSLSWNYAGESWAASKDGIEQAGCIHTIQGLEFDWIGVLIGDDLFYNEGKVLGDPNKRARTDKSLHGWKKDFKKAKNNPEIQNTVMGRVNHIIKSTYRVLLSRGRRGCYVWCKDKALSAYLKERVALAKAVGHKSVPTLVTWSDERIKSEAFKTILPAYSLKAAAGYFGKSEAVDPLGWIEVSTGRKLSNEMFVAQVIGKSMEPLIKDGSYCIFRFNPQGPRRNKIVLAQHHSISDPETGGSYTVKRYRSEKSVTGEESWKHEKIELFPENPDFTPIVIGDPNDEEIKIIAELLEVLK